MVADQDDDDVGDDDDDGIKMISISSSGDGIYLFVKLNLKHSAGRSQGCSNAGYRPWSEKRFQNHPKIQPTSGGPRETREEGKPAGQGLIGE